MATATKKARAATSLTRAAPLEFLTYPDNGGNYHWEIVDTSGEILARSGSFASQDDAERAASHVHEGASSARFEQHVTKERRSVAA